MMEKIKANLSYILCASLGLFHFIFMAFRFLSAFYKYDGERESYKFCNGYGLMKFSNFKGSDGSALAVFAGLLQIILLLLALGLLAYGVMGLLKGLGVFEQFPERVGKFPAKKLAELAMLGYVATLALIFMILLVWCLVNTNTSKWGSYKFRSGVTLSWGMYVTLLLSGSVAACPFVLPMLIPELAEGNGPQVAYHCAQCGKKAGKNEKFCNVCGGAVVAEEVKQYNYVCAGCGKKAKKTDKFCNVCGGAIEAVEVKHYEHVCSGCGKKAKKTDKFCNVCGGAIVEREIVAAAPVAPAAPVAQEIPASQKPMAPAANVCASCGNVIAEGNKFCNICGTPVAAPAAPAAPVAPVAPVANVCPVCGKTVAEGNKFCNFCGAQL